MVDSQANKKAVCLSCLDQRYELYLNGPSGSEDVAPILTGHLTYDMRYRIITFNGLEQAAQSGCWFCFCIQEGINLFWDELIVGSDMCALEEEDSYGLCVQLRPGRSLIVSWVWSGHVVEVTDGDLGSRTVLSEDHWIRLVQPLEFYTSMAESGHWSDSDSTSRDSHCSFFGTASEIPEKLDLQSCRQILEPWLASCELGHHSCRQRDEILPRRVLDISGEIVRLVETRGFNDTAYTTLSHCWGSPEAGGIKFQTTKDNIEARKSGTHLGDFPKTFRDAIEIANSLGCRYIWIDSLCIIQDDEQDWKEQAMQMASIYTNSYLNIGATASSNNQGGCLKSRRAIYESIDMNFDVEEPRRSHQIQGNIGVRRYCDVAHRHFSEVVETHKSAPPLLTRAWVFQERLLAPRTVHFAGSELVWECRTCMSCECRGLEGLQERHWFKAQFNQSLEEGEQRANMFDEWLRVVSQYSKLNLTYPSDWPYALAGLATVIKQQLQCRYLAGIWEKDLPRALLWRNTSQTQCGSKDIGAPTWSCNSRHLQLGAEGAAISYTALLENGFEPDYRLSIDFSETLCLAEDGNQFGTVTAGCLKTEAAMRRGLLELTGSADEKTWRIAFRTGPGTERFNVWTDYDLSENGPSQFLPGSEISALLIGTTTRRKDREYVLILAPAKGSKSCFQRVGIAYFDSAKEIFKASGPPSVEII